MFVRNAFAQVSQRQHVCVICYAIIIKNLDIPICPQIYSAKSNSSAFASCNMLVDMLTSDWELRGNDLQILCMLDPCADEEMTCTTDNKHSVPEEITTSKHLRAVHLRSSST